MTNTENNTAELATFIKEKVVIGQIADATGHTDFTGGLNAAVKNIIGLVKSTSKLVYVNGNPFFFEGDFSKAGEARLTAALDEEEEPTFVVTEALVGGAVDRKFAVNITKKPLGSFITGKTRPHIVISLSKAGKVKTATAYISDYNGARDFAREMLEEILCSIITGVVPTDAQHTKQAKAQKAEKPAAKAKCAGKCKAKVAKKVAKVSYR